MEQTHREYIHANMFEDEMQMVEKNVNLVKNQHEGTWQCSVNIDELFVSQDVTLRFSALDQRQTPELFGKVIKISADAFVDESTRATYYSAEIILNDGQIDRLPANVTLIPGMPVEAFIRTSDRSPLSYLVKPLTDYFAKAFREG